MHAGYGIGAMLIVQLLKPFLKFNPKESSDRALLLNSSSNSSIFLDKSANSTLFNETSSITSSAIQLQIPYSIAGIVGAVTIIIFTIAQFFEFKQVKKSAQYNIADETPLKNMNVRQNTNRKKGFHLTEIIFGRYIESTKDTIIMFIELIILFNVFMAVMAFNMVLTSYMLTYATKGPAKFARNDFLTIQTLFWIIFIVGRFSAALIGFKLNSFYFFTFLSLLNGVFSVILSTKLNEIQASYWFTILAIGFTNGPLIPSAFAVAKYVFVKTNALLVSIFCIGLGIGSLGSTYLTGYLLDVFKPKDLWLGYKNPQSAYAIPLILVTISVYNIAVTIIALIVYRAFKDSFTEKD